MQDSLQRNGEQLEDIMFYLALHGNFTVVYLESNVFNYLFIELTIALLSGSGGF